MFSCPECYQPWQLLGLLFLFFRPIQLFILSFFSLSYTNVQSNTPLEKKGMYYGTIFSNDTWSKVQSYTERKRFLVVKFSAEYCRPCHLIAPEFKKLANTFDCIFCDIEVNRAETQHLCIGVNVVPTFIVYSCKGLSPLEMIKFEGANLQSLKDYLSSRS